MNFINFFIFLSIFSLADQPSVRCVARNRMMLRTSLGSVELDVGYDAQAVNKYIARNENLVIPVNGDQPYLETREFKPQRVNRSLTFNEERLVRAIRSIDGDELKLRVKKCYNGKAKKNIKRLLQEPLTDKEQKVCKDHLLKVRKFEKCHQNKNCSQVFSQYYNPSGSLLKEKDFSFLKLVTSWDKIPKEVQTVAVGSALSNGGNAAGMAVVYKRRAWLTRFLGKVGYRASYPAVYVGSFAFYPIAHLLTKDHCQVGEVSLSSSDNNLEDCLGKTASSLNRLFGGDINKAIEKPTPFLNRLKGKDSGLSGRLACALVEAKSEQWDQLLGMKIQCSGLTLLTSGEFNYQFDHKNKGLVYRHLDRDTLVYFDSRREHPYYKLVGRDEIFEFQKGSDQSPRARRQERQRPIKHLTEKLEQEHLELKTLQFRIEHQVESCLGEPIEDGQVEGSRS